MEKIKIGMLGYGTVGTGVGKIIEKSREELAKKTGYDIEIVKVVVKNLDKKRDTNLPASIFSDKAEDVIENPDIDIVIEVMGGIDETKAHILTALNNGKHVISANKDLIAEKGKEIFETADAKGLDFKFEASVAGAIPIIRALKESLAGDKITEVMGILNGTTNFILSKMTAEGADFAEVLAEAQELGYAEADPTADVEGLDAARKTAILASIAFNSRVNFDQVSVEGITNISARDIANAKALGYVIKLLGVAKEDKKGIEVRVHPTFIPTSHPLATVNDVYNAVFVKGEALGDAMFYGRGAGELPTASAIVGDLVEVLRNKRSQANGRVGCTCFYEKPIKDKEDSISRAYISLIAKDEAGVLAGITKILGDYNVSVESIFQQGRYADGCTECIRGEAEVVLITHSVSQKDLHEAVGKIEKLDKIIKICNVIRVEKGGR